MKASATLLLFDIAKVRVLDNDAKIDAGGASLRVLLDQSLLPRLNLTLKYEKHSMQEL